MFKTINKWISCLILGRDQTSSIRIPMTLIFVDCRTVPFLFWTWHVALYSVTWPRSTDKEELLESRVSLSPYHLKIYHQLFTSWYTHCTATYTEQRQRHFANSPYSACRHTVEVTHSLATCDPLSTLYQFMHFKSATWDAVGWDPLGRDPQGCDPFLDYERCDRPIGMWSTVLIEWFEMSDSSDVIR